VIVLPLYQRTFVSTHAIGLLLDYALQKPGDGGLGLRRVQWMAHADNTASVRAAERMGFKMEGVLRYVVRLDIILSFVLFNQRVESVLIVWVITFVFVIVNLRWDRTVPIDKENGIKPREGDVLQLRGRHSAILAMCWDDWEDGGREHVRKMMARRS
jgi:hypothetical protein